MSDDKTKVIDQAVLDAYKPYFGSIERGIEEALKWQREREAMIELYKTLREGHGSGE